jgi:NTE family protein
MKRALVLSGGGSKGSFQIGVLKKLVESDPRGYDLICGVSVGAINAAGLAMFSKQHYPDAVIYMEKMWRERVRTSTIYKRWFPFGRLEALWKKSVYDSSPLRKLMQENLDLQKVRSSGVDVAVGAVSLENQAFVFGTQNNDNFVDWVLASSSFPIFLTPIQIDGQSWSDGGIRSTTPLGHAIKSGADEIDVVLCYDPDWVAPNWDSESERAVPDQLVRVLNIMSDQIAVSDLKIAGLKNELVQVDDKYRKIKMKVYCPATGIPVSDSLIFDPEQIAKAIDVGYSGHRLCMIYE